MTSQRHRPMYDPTGRIVAGAFAAVLLYLSIMGIKTGVIFGRGIAYRLKDNRPAFLATLTAQFGFATFLLMIAAGYEPIKLLKRLFEL